MSSTEHAPATERDRADVVAASNALTARWAATLSAPESTVLSGLGVWPLLGLLRDAAAGPARDELAAAAGAGAPATLLQLLDDAAAVSGALALWTAADLPVHAAWRRGLPGGAHRILSGDRSADQRAMDAWAAEQTQGLIDHLPVTLDEQTRLVLASALAVRTEWQRPFTQLPDEPTGGPWAGRTITGLHRTGPDRDQVAVTDTAAGPVTLARVTGRDDVDVVLLLGAADRSPGAVLAAGVAALDQPPTTTGAQWSPGPSPGPGLTVTREAWARTPILTLELGRFTVRASHDLLGRAELFGLATAQDRRRGHFPGLSPDPLCVAQARQDAVAIFSATGFRAAAVTAMAAMAGAALPSPAGATVVRARFDRPFGFAAVHRPTGLVLVAGWVADPDPWDESDALVAAAPAP